MNARVLEIIQNPQIISENDLGILEKEIAQSPYAQGLRALYLYGLSCYKKEEYATQLATTAAFTTDKKILYTFINGEKQKPKLQDAHHATLDATTIPNELDSEKEIQKTSEIINEPTAIITDSEHEEVEQTTIIVQDTGNNELKTRVLESNADEQVEIMISEESVEDGQESIVEVSMEGNSILEEPSTIEQIKTEDMISEEMVEETSDATTENNKITEKDAKETNKEDDAPLNFHGVDEFLPQVAMMVPSKEKSSFIPTQLPSDKEKKQQDEMQRLIAEVEAKMKAKKQNQATQVEADLTPEVSSHEINFSEVHDVFLERKEIVSESALTKVGENTENANEWVPMTGQSVEPSGRFASPESQLNIAIEPLESDTKIETDDEPSVENSFSEEKQSLEHSSEKITTETIPDKSNVPQFINTWHSWLKLDKEHEDGSVLLDVNKKDDEKISEDTVEIPSTELSEQESQSQELDDSLNNSNETIQEVSSGLIIDEEILPKDDQKNKAIDTFIENEPKISKLKESTEFLHKDRGDDISHLMTDTLVSLYIEQRLYTKAIQGYEILMEKFPEKKEEYLQKIESVKALKLNPRSGE
ncbi:MAG: hypothetical protein JSS94_01370 [Bacteroidetes bacterium]|nr:hypothetical protein [Bacteroidota bacterium]